MEWSTIDFFFVSLKITFHRSKTRLQIVYFKGQKPLLAFEKEKAQSYEVLRDIIGFSSS